MKNGASLRLYVSVLSRELTPATARSRVFNYIPETDEYMVYGGEGSDMFYTVYSAAEIAEFVRVGRGCMA